MSGSARRKKKVGYTKHLQSLSPRIHDLFSVWVKTTQAKPNQSYATHTLPLRKRGTFTKDLTALHITAEINGKLDQIRKNTESIKELESKNNALTIEIEKLTRELYKESECYRNEQKRNNL